MSLVLFVIIFGVLAVTASINAQTGKLKNSTADENRGQEKKEAVKAEIQAKFCERISELAEKVGQRFSQKREQLQNRNQERQDSWEDAKSQRDAKLADFRSKRDANLEDHLKRLEERATTEEQKKTANEFQKTVRAAIEARRSAIDGAISNFRAGVKNLHASRQTAVNGEVEDFINAQKAAFEKSQAECEKGISPASARQAAHTALKAARTGFSAEKQNREKTRTRMEALIQTRKAAFEKAITDFKSAMEKAKIQFKKSFPEDVDPAEE